MKFRLYTLIVLALLGIGLRAEAHPYHVSIAEVSYNPKSQALEIAIKVFTDDLEKTLSDAAKKPVTLQQSPDVKSQLAAYLKKTFQVEINAKQVLPQKFLGFETEDDAQWLYLEIPVKPEQLKQLTLRNKVLFETFEDQMNLMNVTMNGQKKTLLFKHNDFVHALL
ncbi:DUF6702 family protein [Adhaeribacter soli]|uniref:Uncharacterized protein n=1 Tax=Adhaeribacter soli TaxID=2607655 RepID=A0A5N1J7Z9_9BACT|nr:DUF6702 family protein [Adhaeribacter soli]KAA9340791.1 hypothetical protein F0P94_05020 [Adhaeribacter soli]